MISFHSYALTLKEAIEDAVIHNPQFREEVKAYRAIEAEVREAKGGYYPTIDLNAGIGYEEVDRSGVGGVDNTGGDGLPRKESSINLTQNLFQGFATQDNVARQQHRLRAQAHQALATANNIALEMTQSYIDLLKEQELLSLAQDNLETHFRILDQIKKRTEAGIGNRVELHQAEARLALAHSSLGAAKNNFQDAKAKFRRVLGRDPDNMLEKPDFGFELPETVETATDIALTEHPQLKSADADVSEAKMQFKASDSNNFPRFDIEISRSMDENLNGVRGREDNFQAMLRMRYNLYNGGRDQAKQERTASQYHQAAEIRNNTRRQVIENLRYAWNANQFISDQLTYVNQHIKLTHDTLIGYRKQFSLGRRSLLDLLNTENEYVSALRTLVTNETDQLNAQYRILSGMGLLLKGLDIHYPFINIPSEEPNHRYVINLGKPEKQKMVANQETTQTRQENHKPISSALLKQKASEPEVPVQTAGLKPEPTPPASEEVLPEPSETSSANKAANPRYTLQLASFAKIEDAQSYIERSAVHDTRLERREVKGQKRYTVVTGHFTGYQEAKEASRKLKEQTGINPWIRPIETDELKDAEPDSTVEKTRSEASANEATNKEGKKPQYTLQLASFAKIKDAKTYIEQSKLSDIRLKRGEVKGQKRFAILKGSFSGYQAAKKASREIQEKNGITPWIRSIKDI